MTDEELTLYPSKKENITIAETLEGKQAYACQSAEFVGGASQFIDISEKKIIGLQESETFYLERFTDPKISLKIIKPIQFRVNFEEDLYFVENEIFDIFSYHKELKKAKIDIEEQLQILWKDFVLEDENKLSSSGILMKNLLKNYMR